MKNHINVQSHPGAALKAALKADFGFWFSGKAKRVVWCVECAEFLFFFGEAGTMPRVFFSPKVQLRLIELWGKYQRENGTMIKRAVAEKRIADELNLCAKQLSGDVQEMIYTAAMVHNSSTLRGIHQLWRRSTEIILADQEIVFLKY